MRRTPCDTCCSAALRRRRMPDPETEGYYDQVGGHVGIWMPIGRREENGERWKGFLAMGAVLLLCAGVLGGDGLSGGPGLPETEEGSPGDSGGPGTDPGEDNEGLGGFYAGGTAAVQEIANCRARRPRAMKGAGRMKKDGAGDLAGI